MKIFTLGLVFFCFTGYGQTEEQYLNKEGDAKINLGDYKEAIAFYTKAIEINPKSTVAYNNRGYAKIRLRNYKEAIADYTKAIEINPYYSSAYFNRGVARKYIRDWVGAISDYTKSIELNPQFVQAYYERGKLYNNSFKESDGKIHGFTDSIEDNRNTMKEINDNANSQYYFNNGYKRVPVEKDYVDAISDFSRVIEINPMYENAYEVRGEIKYNLKDYKGAIIDLTMAVKNNPKDKYAWYYMGWSKLLSGQKDSGCLDLRKSGELGYEKAYNVIRKYCN
jgi:tetratricopeptide (TPR) repeat protein